MTFNEMLIEKIAKMDHELVALRYEASELKERVEHLESIAPTRCTCRNDWTDGGRYCQECRLERS